MEKSLKQVMMSSRAEKGLESRVESISILQSITDNHRLSV
jgi:hypothetical protein